MRLTFGLLAVLLGGCLAGCVSEGHRKITVQFLGQTFTWEDETLGEEWRSDTAPGSPIVEWFVRPEEETKDGVGDDPDGTGD